MKRASVLAILVLASSQISLLASAQIEIKHNWSVIGPGGHYGFFQYTTGPGPFDAHTALLFGARNADIPAPLFVVVTSAALPFFMLVLLSRGLFTGTFLIANHRPALDAAMSTTSHFGDDGRRASEPERSAQHRG